VISDVGHQRHTAYLRYLAMTPAYVLLDGEHISCETMTRIYAQSGGLRKAMLRQQLLIQEDHAYTFKTSNQVYGLTDHNLPYGPNTRSL